MGQGATTSPMWPMNHSYLANGVHPLLPHLRCSTVLPEEVSYTSPRVRAYNEDTTEEALQDSLDKLDEHSGGARPISMVSAIAT